MAEKLYRETLSMPTHNSFVEMCQAVVQVLKKRKKLLIFVDSLQFRFSASTQQRICEPDTVFGAIVSS